MSLSRLAVLLIGLLQSIHHTAEAGVIFVHTDHQGTPVAYSDAQGNVIGEEATTPFGESLNPPTSDDQPAYTGHVRDGSTGLIYMQARYYDPVVGRFLSTDPVGFEEGGVDYFNRYSYVANNPIGKIDPDGRDLIAIGNAESADRLRGTIRNVKNTSPTAGAVLQGLEDDKSRITFVKEGEHSRYDPGTNTIYISYGEEKVEIDGEPTAASPERKLAHESKHAEDESKGLDLKADLNENGMKDTEERASELESTYGAESGDGGERTGYHQFNPDGQKVEKFEKQDDGTWKEIE